MIAIVLPVFGVMAAGYGAAWTPLFGQEARQGLAQFVFFFALPVMLFHKLGSAELPSTIAWGYFGAYYLGALLTFVVTVLLGGLMTKAALRSHFLDGFAATYGNTVLVGIPVVLSGLGDDAAVPLFLLISFHSIIFYTFITFLVEGWGRSDADEGGWHTLPWRLAKGLFTNPILLAVLGGALWNRADLGFYDLVDRWAELFGQAALPCALFSLGASLKGYKLAGQLPLVAMMTAVKLLVMPLIVWGLGLVVFDMPPLWLAVAVIAAAMPAGVNTYLFAVRYRQSEAEVAATILVSTLLSILTISALLGHFRSLL